MTPPTSPKTPRRPSAVEAEQPDWILETRGLGKRFDGFAAVHDVSLRIQRGHVHALIGPNGAGKTTCFNLLTKVLTPSAGTILFEGRDITRKKAAEVALLGMVRSFQISAIFASLSVLDNVRVALQRPLGLSLQFWRSSKALDSLNERALQLLGDVGLEAMAQRTAGELSYGHKRALEMATTLALDPTLLLLDEPTSGMGREDVQWVTDLIERVAVSRTVLMVEHNLGVVARLADRVSVLAQGELLAEGTYDEVSRNETVMSAYLGKKPHAAV